MNGEKLLEYDIDSDVWRAHVKTSKYFQTAYGQGNWGHAPKGHIALQDYGGAIEYRNIKIRPATPPENEGQRTTNSSINPVGSSRKYDLETNTQRAYLGAIRVSPRSSLGLGAYVSGFSF
jgi:hypothetical protein